MKSEVVLRHVRASHLLLEELRRERITKQRTDSEGRGDLIIGHTLNIYSRHRYHRIHRKTLDSMCKHNNYAINSYMCIFLKVASRRPRFSSDSILNSFNSFSFSSNKRKPQADKCNDFCNSHFCSFTLSTCKGSPQECQPVTFITILISP